MLTNYTSISVCRRWKWGNSWHMPPFLQLFGSADVFIPMYLSIILRKIFFFSTPAPPRDSSGHLCFTGIWCPVFLVSEYEQNNSDSSQSCLSASTPRLRQLCVYPREPRELWECVWCGSDSLRVPFGSHQEDVHGRCMPFSLRKAKAIFYSELRGVRELPGKLQYPGGRWASSEECGIQAKATWALPGSPRSWLPLEPVQSRCVSAGAILQLTIPVPQVPLPETKERKVSYPSRGHPWATCFFSYYHCGDHTAKFDAGRNGDFSFPVRVALGVCYRPSTLYERFVL